MKLLFLILLGLLLFLLFLLFLPLRLICTVDTTTADTAAANSSAKNEFTLTFCILSLKFRIYPKKRRLPNLKHYRIGALEKRYRKQKRNEARKMRKHAQKQNKNTKRGKAKQTKKPQKRNIRQLLRLIFKLFRVLTDRFGRYLRVDIAYFDIIAAAENPADTAVLYGWIYAAMEHLWAVCSEKRIFRHVRKNQISIYADFGRTKPAIRAKLTFSVMLWQAAIVLIHAGAKALTVRNEAYKNESEQEKADRMKAQEQARAEMIRELKGTPHNLL